MCVRHTRNAVYPLTMERIEKRQFDLQNPNWIKSTTSMIALISNIYETCQ